MKKSKVLFLVLALALSLISCTTAMKVKSVVPGRVAISTDKTIGIAPVEFSCSTGFGASSLNISLAYSYEDRPSYYPNIYWRGDGSLQSKYIRMVESNLTSTLNLPEFFTTKSPSQVEPIITSGRYYGSVKESLENNGIDYLVKCKITDCTVSNVIEVYSKKGVQMNPTTYKQEEYLIYYYYLKTQCRVELKYDFYGVEANRNIESDTVYATSSDSSLIGTYDYYGRSWHSKEGFDADSTVKDVIYSAFSRACSALSKSVSGIVPHYVYEQVSFMSNKPKDELYTIASKCVENGDLVSGLSYFEKAWKENKHVPSGYNAAILYQTMGNLDSAISLMREVAKYSANEDALKRLYIMETQKKNQEEVESLNVGTKDTTVDELDIFVL